MTYKQIKAMIANPGESRWYRHSYAIYHEFGVFCLVHADCEQDALDIAVDNGRMDCMAMNDEDYQEYSTAGWDDSYLLLGNASEPFWSEYLGIKQIH